MRAGLRECHWRDLRRAGGGDGGARIGRAALDPLGEDGDVGGVERFLGRHLQIFVGVTDRFDEETPGGLAGENDCAGVAAGLPAGTGIEAEAALLFFVAVALVAALGEDWTDFGFEEREVVGRQRGRRRGRGWWRGRRRGWLRD